MPVHGQHYRVKMHAELAHQLGTPKENIVVPDNGSVINPPTTDKITVLKEKAPSDDMMVEGFTIGDMQEVVIRDRKMLAEEGMFVIITTINVRTGKLRKSQTLFLEDLCIFANPRTSSASSTYYQKNCRNFY